MIAQISSPLRGLILLFIFLASLYVFHPYTTSRPSFSFSDWKTNNATSPHIAQDNRPASLLSNAAPSTTKPATDNAPEIAQNLISGDIVDDANEGGPRIRQATMIYETEQFNAVYERSTDTHIKHGEQWGVPTHILRHDVVEAGFFNKPAYILGLIIEEMAKPYGKRAGWIVWFDADTIILNPAVPWSLFLPPPDFNEVHLIATQDQNGFNAGMAIFRVTDWSVQMLSEVVALRQLRPEVQIDFYDQGALRWVFERRGYEEHVIYQPHNWWNSFGLNKPPYDTDAFMLHFAGADCCGQEDSKGTVMGRWLDILENNPRAYAVELEKTKLPKEVKDFWAMLQRAKKAMQDVTSVENTSQELQTATNNLWTSYLRSADNATEVTMAIEKVESILAQKGTKAGKPSEPQLNTVEEALKEEKAKTSAEDKTKQKAEQKKAEDSAKKKEKPAAKEEASAKKESVEATKKAAQAKAEAASEVSPIKDEAAAKKEPGPPPNKNNRRGIIRRSAR